jgi:hypothetical protein
LSIINKVYGFNSFSWSPSHIPHSAIGPVLIHIKTNEFDRLILGQHE